MAEENLTRKELSFTRIIKKPTSSDKGASQELSRTNKHKGISSCIIMKQQEIQKN